jgi:DNA-binding response OmpR family regulator
MRLLLVEDDLDLASALTDALKRHGVTGDHAATAADADLMLQTASYAAVLLDLGLPDEDGLTVVQALRRRNDPIPVIILSAREDVEDRIGGLDAGADDYLAKPFAVEELLARLRAVMRRPAVVQPRVLAHGNVRYDPELRELDVDGATVPLSQREAELMELLMRRAGRTVPRALAEDQLFGLESAVGSNALEVYVHRLRRKLEGAGASLGIETVRGIGYLLREAA